MAQPGDPPWPPLAHPHTAGDPDKAFDSRVTMLDALAMLVWGIMGQVVVVAIAAGIGVDLESTRATALLTIAMQAVVLAGILIFLRWRRVSLWRVLGPVRPRWTHIPIGIGLGLVGVLLVLVASALITSLFPDVQPPSQALLEILGTDVVTTVAVVVAAAVMAPLVEEIQYRSLLFQSTRSRVGLPGAMVLSSLVFVGAHVEVWGSLPALGGLLVLALWLAAIFHQTGTLVVPIVAHASFNAAMLGLSLALPSELTSV
ncbi:MAG TPA: type II CAAX endopeptidase family protein [Nitriliruptoraceae bacterium]|nr:type II CAAX endopeptidase family protein [Nitriliruptoraceae bacterium]